MKCSEISGPGPGLKARKGALYPIPTAKFTSSFSLLLDNQEERCQRSGSGQLVFRPNASFLSSLPGKESAMDRLQ